jgi:hypothetical protein
MSSTKLLSSFAQQNSSYTHIHTVYKRNEKRERERVKKFRKKGKGFGNPMLK